MQLVRLSTLIRVLTTRKIVNLLLFQIAWFAAVLGAADGNEWQGPLAVILVLAVHLALTQDRRGELKLLLVAGVLGFCFDTALKAGGIVDPRGDFLPHPFSEPWMVSMWLNLAATLNVSLAWLKGRYPLAALFGGIGGGAAYYGGARMGATVSLPDAQGIIILIVGWGIMMPILVWLAEKFQSRSDRDAQHYSLSRSR